MTSRVREAAVKRQKILDFCNAHKGGIVSASVLSKFMGLTVKQVSRMLSDMADMGELKRHGKGNVIWYTPNTTTTRSYEKTMQLLYEAGHRGGRNGRAVRKERRQDSEDELRARRRAGQPGVTTNNSNDGVKNPGAGGQGATIRVTNGVSTLGGVW